MKTVAIIFTLITTTFHVYASPIDWKGKFGVDTTSISNYRRTESAPTNFNQSGSTEISEAVGAEDDASFQTYIFRLQPNMIINDSASFKAEISTGYGYGGRLGDSSERSNTGNFGNALYFYNTSSDTSNLNIRKFQMELYSDTGTYIIGRQSSHWGLGAVVNEGSDLWDRHATIRDGLNVNFNIGNFKISPFWFKIDLSGNSRSDGLTSNNKTSEYGISLLYDNPEKEFAFGVLYSKKSSKGTTFTKSDNSSLNLDITEAKLISLHLKKSFNQFKVGVEAPFISGDIGPVYVADTNVSYKANALIFESNYEASNSWTFGFDAGWATGDDGESSSFKAMYLHPNYKIANLMFHYNLEGLSSPDTHNLHDSYLTNLKYYKLYAKYLTGAWVWKTSFIMATAEEVAKNGGKAHNHEKNKSFTASADQDDSYGWELDIDFDYSWNSKVTIGGNFGYLNVGDYYKFNDSANPVQTKNSYVVALKTMLEF